MGRENGVYASTQCVVSYADMKTMFIVQTLNSHRWVYPDASYSVLNSQPFSNTRSQPRFEEQSSKHHKLEISQ